MDYSTLSRCHIATEHTAQTLLYTDTKTIIKNDDDDMPSINQELRVEMVFLRKREGMDQNQGAGIPMEPGPGSLYNFF